jgi:hypothetical protein
MALDNDLSTITFTEQDDVVPQSGVERPLINSGIANTLAGNDTITGIGYSDGLFNGFSFPNDNNNPSIIDTGKGDDIITGISYQSNGFLNWSIFDIINTGDGNDIINGVGYYSGIINGGSMDTGGGNDIITGIESSDNANEAAFINSGFIDTSDGNDVLTGIGAIAILNVGTINTGNGEDSIISQGKLSSGIFRDFREIDKYQTFENGNEGFINRGEVFLGDDNDSLVVEADVPKHALLKNLNFIGTGEGNDTITSTGVIYNEGVIETGNGDDSIIVDGGIDIGWDGNKYSIYNNGGTINMGNGNDSLIANESFHPGSGGSVFLGNGKDYFKGFGNGEFSGGNGNDTLELTSGTYTIGIWYTTVTFTKGSSFMIASEFEKLIAGSTNYDFSSLTKGQTITVA